MPAAYLEVIGDAPELPADFEEIATSETNYYDSEPVPEHAQVCVEPVLHLFLCSIHAHVKRVLILGR